MFFDVAAILERHESENPMNHKLWSSVGARVLAVSFVLAGVSACNRHHDEAPTPSVVSPSAQVIGVEPAAPTGDPAGTTPVANASTTNEMSKSVESQSMPLPGQPNDHSNVAAKPSENAETKEVLKSTEEAKNANSGPSLERTRQ
jgi:hypothetical protein